MNEVEPIISIIVPVYNVEEFLEECLNSIVSQTYKNIEIICVNDGSPDNSKKILEDFQKRDSRIKVFEKENGGLSDARNFGHKKSKGEYIAFVDSDDVIDPNFIYKLYKAIIENNTKVSICNFSHLTNGKLLPYCDLPNDKLIEFSNNNYFDLIGQYHNTAWRKLYHKSVIQDIDFPKGILHEDIGYWLIVLSNVDKIALVPEQLYFYRQDNEKAITKNMSRRNAIHGRYSYKYAYDYIMSHNKSKNVQRMFLQSFLNLLQAPISGEVSKIEREIANKLSFLSHTLDKNDRNKLNNFQNSGRWFVFTPRLLSINLFPFLKHKIFGFKVYLGGLFRVEFFIGRKPGF